VLKVNSYPTIILQKHIVLHTQINMTHAQVLFSLSVPISYRGWDLVEWLERCASIPMITSSNPSGGSEFTCRSDVLLTARGGCMRALLVEFACLPCYPGNTLCSQRLEPPERAGIGAIQIPRFFFVIIIHPTPVLLTEAMVGPD
jgi:hypothetical protein